MEGVFACVLYKNMDHAGRALLIYHVAKERPKAWKEFSKNVLSLPGKLYWSVSSNNFHLTFTKLKDEQTKMRLGILELAANTQNQWELERSKLLNYYRAAFGQTFHHFPFFYISDRINHTTGPPTQTCASILPIYSWRRGKFVRAPGGSRTMIK